VLELNGARRRRLGPKRWWTPRRPESDWERARWLVQEVKPQLQTLRAPPKLPSGRVE
jgi:hypothetical protein